MTVTPLGHWIVTGRSIPQLAGSLPLHEQFPETLHGRRIIILLPDENERDTLERFQQNEMKGRSRGDDGFGNNADARARFHVTHHGADEARRMGQTRSHTRLPAASNDRIVKSHAFAAGEDDERFASERGP